MNLLRLLPLAGLLTVGALTTTPARSTAVRQHQATPSYQDGYTQGYNETQQNKCIDKDYFEKHYRENYLPRAQSNADYYAYTTYGPYYQGYLDGLETAYGEPAFCN